MKKKYKTFIFILILSLLSAWISLPENSPLGSPTINFSFFGKHVYKKFELKKGLDIQGGVQVILQAQMAEIAPEDRDQAMESAREIIARRVDMYGVSEPVIQTSKKGDEYRLIVELAGVEDASEALKLIGTTAQLDFRLQNEEINPVATESAVAFLSQFSETGLGGSMLKRSTVQFDQQGQPIVSLEFTPEGRDLFADITKANTGQVLGIFLDGFPLMMPVIQTAILDGRAIISGNFDLEEAKNLSIQLNAGALPVSIKVLEQRNIGASLGQQSVEDSIKAGLIGLGLVMIFMFLYYGKKGLIADSALLIYALLTVAIYKIFGVVLTLPGIAGLLLSIGMAVDANILIFERMKEELRLGRSQSQAMELGFGRAWDSIKDANLATIVTALILINPLDFGFLNTSGLVRGFGITLLIGVLISLFTGVVVTRTLMRIFMSK
ncbi:MAG: protein translocase subunit SecD [Patescibacteria group bacterium]